MKENTIAVLGLKQFTGEDRPFYVNTLSNHLKTSHQHINTPHRHNFFAAFLFVQGSGTHEIDFTAYDIRPGSVFLLSPGQTHNWELSDDCEGIVFFHSQDFYETHYIHEMLRDYPFFSFIQNQAAIFLDEGKLSEIKPLFEKILTINADSQSKKKQLLLSIITQVYIELERYITKDNPVDANAHNGYYLKFLQFQKLVENNFHTEKSASAYADRMNMTPKHLNRINKLILNKTTSEIISDRIVLEAKRRLIYARNNLTEVAAALGFDDYAHFSKLFKNKTGLTPGAFSKKYV